MGGRRITEDQINRAIGLRTKGLTLQEIADIVGASAPSIRYYTKDVIPIIELGQNEQIADIEGYDGRYKVTSYGRVFTAAKGEHNLKELQVIELKKGPRKVALNHGNKTSSKAFFIDELVANAFVDRESDDCVNIWHIDGDLSNDCANNLRWSDTPQVTKYARRNKTYRKLNELSDVEKDEIGQKWANGSTMSELATEYNTSIATINKQVEGLPRNIIMPECEPGEEWEEVPGYDGKYYISSHGRVFTAGRGKARIKPRIVRLSRSYDGYFVVSLINDAGVSRMERVHRLVAEAFCSGRTETCNIVNHKDGNILNNDKSNLEWCTAAYNTIHASRVLGRKFGGNDQTLVKIKRDVPVDSTSKSSPFRKFTDDEVRAIRADNRSAGKIAEEYGVSKSTIIRMKHGETYKNI